MNDKTTPPPPQQNSKKATFDLCDVCDPGELAPIEMISSNKCLVCSKNICSDHTWVFRLYDDDLREWVSSCCAENGRKLTFCKTCYDVWVESPTYEISTRLTDEISKEIISWIDTDINNTRLLMKRRE